MAGNCERGNETSIDNTVGVAVEFIKIIEHGDNAMATKFIQKNFPYFANERESTGMNVNVISIDNDGKIVFENYAKKFTLTELTNRNSESYAKEQKYCSVLPGYNNLMEKIEELSQERDIETLERLVNEIRNFSKNLDSYSRKTGEMKNNLLDKGKIINEKIGELLIHSTNPDLVKGYIGKYPMSLTNPIIDNQTIIDAFYAKNGRSEAMYPLLSRKDLPQEITQKILADPTGKEYLTGMEPTFAILARKTPDRKIYSEIMDIIDTKILPDINKETGSFILDNVLAGLLLNPLVKEKEFAGKIREWLKAGLIPTTILRSFNMKGFTESAT